MSATDLLLATGFCVHFPAHSENVLRSNIFQSLVSAVQSCKFKLLDLNYLLYRCSVEESSDWVCNHVKESIVSQQKEKIYKIMGGES